MVAMALRKDAAEIESKLAQRCLSKSSQGLDSLDDSKMVANYEDDLDFETTTRRQDDDVPCFEAFGGKGDSVCGVAKTPCKNE